MAGSYVLPQVRVFQEFAETPNDVMQNLNPFVIGANYQLIRYSDKDERSDCTKATYSGAEKVLAWAAGDTGSIVDTKTCYGVTFAKAYAKMGDPLTGTCLDGKVSEYGTKFEFELDGKSLTGETVSRLQFGTPVKPGDYLQYSVDGGKVKRTKIKEISCGKIEAESISYTLKDASGGTSTVLEFDFSDYVGEKPFNATIRVKSKDGSGLEATWSSSTPGMSQSTPQTLSASDSSWTDFGNGAKIKGAAGLTAGQYKLSVKVSEGVVKDTVTVTDLVPVTSGMSFTFVRYFDEVKVSNDFLTANDTGVTVAASATVPFGAMNFEVIEAEAYLTQRNFLKTYSDGIYSATSDAEIFRALGPIVPENPLAYGAHIMRLNCATTSIKYLALESDDAEGWAKAIDRASVTNEVYAFCPLTEDASIIERVVAHCEQMSSPAEKSWRIAFFSLPTVEETDVTPNDEGVLEKCTVDAKRILTCRPTGGSVTDISSVATFVDSVRPGDVVTVVNTAGIEKKTTVKAVKSNTTLELADDVSDASAALCSFWIVHRLGISEYVSQIAETSKHFRNSRAYNVFPNSLRDSNGTFVSGMYAAAAVCGLACSVAPQQPITNVEIKGFSDLPDVYSKYSRDQLNEIAAGGTLILMQDRIGGTVYVRHQISTAYSDGNLNDTELSLVKNLDSISYYFANRFAPYIGRYNVTEDLLTELKGVLKDGLAYLETATEGSKLVGPQIIAEGTEVRQIYRSTEEKDKVYANVALNLPAPFNNFDLHLQVI